MMLQEESVGPNWNGLDEHGWDVIKAKRISVDPNYSVFVSFPFFMEG